jgi:KDO2-lipid IV(A) lauroyltransferase|tara:strand:- start:2010 stop:2906 length:897 start_codon:yes stop_codon:yes gene_type:complete
METALYLIARCVVGIASCLPLTLVAWCGRRTGAIAWYLDKRHRNVAIQNIQNSFPEKNEEEIRMIAQENFRRLGETYASILKAGRMKENEIPEILTIEGYEVIEDILKENPEERIILAAGHFGNFELFSWLKLAAPSVRQWITTYRGLRQERLTKLLLDLRKASGVQYLDRRDEGPQIKKAMDQPSIVLGLVADQHAGVGGLRLPVFGREASVSPAPAIMAKRYNCRLFPTVCFRTKLGRWKIELGNEIPIRENGKRRSTEDITLDIIAAHENYIRRDPSNWFWVHNRWKSRPKAEAQ